MSAEARAQVVDCPQCDAPAGQPCRGVTRAHKARHEAYADFVREAFCANESQYGYPCGVAGCSSCGGARALPTLAFVQRNS